MNKAGATAKDKRKLRRDGLEWNANAVKDKVGALGQLTAYFWSVFGAKNAKFSSRGSAPHPAGAASPRPQAGAPPQTPS